ncbi:ABC transporter substrate-binding protein [Jiella sp. KSK16Y-1]|uniref:ABC transporter substrate-binding protein n=1 Tax=Jiella mangrovi TaxID=2821407 RepID=A0ABS4BLX5_9HYPH|nr:ABC transporter substrate-binding protein [Jiella mangrovi]MBP0617728.1 ABC transporter substrate-binding protein [Jiella mangrovi]
MALVLTTPLAYADKANDTLDVAFTKELENVDSYFNSSREGVVLQRAVWDGLIYRDPKTGDYVGNLATEWKWIDDKTLELKLRKGVKFHNGADFTADDVVATVNFVSDIKNGVKTQRNVDWMKGAEKVDDYTVRIMLKAPFPAAIEYLAGPVSIYPKEYYEKVGPSGMGLKPVGTGPYKVESVDPGKHFVLVKNEDYFDGPKGKAKIGKIDIRTIPDVNTQLADLFSGTLDFLWQVPADQAEQMAQMGQFTVANESTMRIGYLTLDSAGRTKSPLTDLKVRQAIAYAIDRKAIVDTLLKGKSKVLHSTCFPSQFGCTEDVPQYSYDPEKAKELLKEAGYPDGFSIEFTGYRDRLYAEAIASYLQAVGIDAKLNMLQYSALREANMKGEEPFTFQTWGSYSISDASASVSQFFKFGSLDDNRDEKVRDWLDIADTSIDPEKRKEYYKKALTRIAEQVYWVPLFTYNTNYVFTKDVAYEPTPDEVLRFVDMSWK